MSLHLGNLSPRARKDELERVFTRFGRCTVQLKEGFGFAVYDFRGDAEKAFRTLKGRKICGESVYLSWSKKQPKPLQRFARPTRSHDMRYERHFDRDDNFVGRNFSRSRRDYTMSDKQLEEGRKRHKSSDIHNDRGNISLNDMGVVHNEQQELALEEGGCVEVEPNQMDDGRWEEEEHINNLQSEANFDAQVEIDRYEPDCGDKIGEEYGNRGLEHQAGSQSVRTSPDKNRRIHPGNKRGHQTCFRCGAAGHKMRDCPSKEALQEISTYHSDHRRDTKDNSEVGRIESRSRGQLLSNNGKLRSGRRPDTDEKPSHSGKDGANRRSSRMENESRRDKRKDFDRKRQRERDDKIVETRDNKMSRVLALSHLHAECTSPELRTSSRSLKPLVGTSSHSRSPIPHSLSASRSNTRSRRFRSKSFKTKSRSRSRSRSSAPSSSLSISLERSLPSSPNKTEVNLNGFSERAPIPPSKEMLTAVSQHFEHEVREENLSVVKGAEQSLSGYTDNATSSRVVEVPIQRMQSEHDSVEETPAYVKHTEVSLNGFVEDDQLPQPQEAALERMQSERDSVEETPAYTKHTEVSLNGFVEDNQIPQPQEAGLERMQSERDSVEETPAYIKHTEVSLNGFVEDNQISQPQVAGLEERQWLDHNIEPQQTDVPLQSEDGTSSGKIMSDMKLEQSHIDGNGDSSAPHLSCEVEVMCSSLEKDEKEFDAVVEKQRETEERENAALEMMKPLEVDSDLDQKAPSKLHVGSHLSICTEELCRVLKHYGLKHPNENEHHQDVEDYFGSSRLWPWEMIYYRRLKKGSISVENYARRVAQNKAFGITDKFIRSSSGWGEYIEDLC
ncbi:uncharacterized protein LOC104898269 [Beta vulgaris subsp. vulgaris]|uniref:uncharacterized protein LOC104898269 n=1 Tax=Beta vulgaris subsp. vulgaris TaxID=3555 RepID=UPI002036CCEC|nr:uncharacterized protein LOC104898269 [Beta vulgaris subsp. vulgaris]